MGNEKFIIEEAKKHKKFSTYVMSSTEQEMH